MGGAHPSFYGAEDVLDSAAANRHGFGHRFKPALHGIEHRFVLPSPDALLLAGRAQRTGCAGTTGLLVEVDAYELAALHSGEPFLELFAGRAPIRVGLGLMNEHGLVPEATRLSRRSIRFGHHRDDASFDAGADLLALIISTIGKSDHLGSAGLGLCGLGHSKQMRAVMALVRHRVGDHYMVLGIDGRLDVVTDYAAMVASGRHRAGIWIGERDLLIGSGL